MTLIQALLCCLLVTLIGTGIMSAPALRRFITRNLGGLFTITYLLGFIIYCYGFWFGASMHTMTVALRAAVSSLEMFALHSDLVEVSESMKEGNTFYMACFAIVHFCAFMLTAIFFIDIFGKRLISRLEAISYGQNRPQNNGRKLILIDGTDSRGLSVAQSIPRSKDTLIVFVKGVIDADVKKFSFADLFMNGLKERSTKNEFERLGRVVFSELPLTISLVQDEGWIAPAAIKMINVFKSAEIYFLAWDSENNAQAAYNLSKALKPGMDVSIHVGCDPTKPHSDKLNGCQYISPVIRAELIARDFANNTPILKEGAGKKTFILGSGNTVQACVVTLIENGFKEIEVADPNVRDHREEFLCFHPGLRDYQGLRFYDFGLEGNALWIYLKNNFKSLSNIVIVSHDDNENLLLASKLAKYAKMNEIDSDALRIYFAENESHLEDQDPYFHPFGQMKSIYEHDNLL